jgi:hypothetical protein
MVLDRSGKLGLYLKKISSETRIILLKGYLYLRFKAAVRILQVVAAS